MNQKSLPQILTGVLVSAVGVGLLLNALNIIELGPLMRNWWPLIIVCIGVISLISNPRTWAWPTLIIAFGAALLLRTNGIIEFNLWSLFAPITLILIGLSIIFKRSWDTTKEATEDTVNASAIFSGQNLRSVSHKFKGGDMTAVFGGIDADLRDAKIDGKEAKMNVFTAFGGIDLKVPEGWVVHVTGVPIFGGWEDKTRKPADMKNAPVLKINGTCLFGGVSIKNRND